MIFVPSGWHHTVENLQDTLSINTNWLNGHNIHWAASLLRSERKAAVEAIEDCRCGVSALGNVHLQLLRLHHVQ